MITVVLHAPLKLLLLFINDIHRCSFRRGGLSKFYSFRANGETLGKLTRANWIKFKRLNGHFIAHVRVRARVYDILRQITEAGLHFTANIYVLY